MANLSTNFKGTVHWAAALALGTTLLACGGGGGGDSSPGAANPVSVTVSGTVTGLGTGLQVSLANAAGAATTFSANGSHTFAASVPGGTTYSIAVTVQPVGQVCTVSNASGTVASAAVGNVAVSCSNSLNLLAGSATGGAGSSDGLGAAASFFAPQQLAVDTAGTLFVADAFNNTIRSISPAGAVSTLAGSPGVQGSTNGTGSAARFAAPFGITNDAQGNLFVADTDNGLIRKIAAGGVVTTLAGAPNTGIYKEGTGALATFGRVDNLAVGPDGNVYVAVSQNNVIAKITPQGVVSTFAGSPTVAGSADGTGTTARLNGPRGLAFDAQGNLYVSELGNHTIRKITPAGVVSTLAGSAGSAGNVNGTGAIARFNQPNGLVVDATGNIYVADSLNNSIRKISPAGVVSTVAGAAGVSSITLTALPAGLFFPKGLALFGGRLFVASGEAVLWMYAP